MLANIQVENVPRYTAEAEIGSLFEKYGTVHGVYCWYGTVSLAFVKMDARSVDRTIAALDGAVFGGHKLSVSRMTRVEPPECLVPFNEYDLRDSDQPVHWTQDKGKTTLCGLTEETLPEGRWKIYHYSKNYIPVNRCPKCTSLQVEAQGRYNAYAAYLRSEKPWDQLSQTIIEARALHQRIDGMLEDLRVAADTMELLLKDIGTLVDHFEG